MGSCLAPVLANIILTEFEKQIVEDLIKAGTIKFYCRYMDDTLVLIKPCTLNFQVFSRHQTSVRLHSFGVK